VTQTYDAGAAVYFYFAMPFAHVFDGTPLDAGRSDAGAETRAAGETRLDAAVELFEAIERDARDEVLRNGGSLSHHHGVGKVRGRWMPEVVSPVGMRMLAALKAAVDPDNVLCCGNFGIRSGVRSGARSGARTRAATGVGAQRASEGTPAGDARAPASRL
jgi:alkyldihydroxyacetonephosphate synthase